MQEKNIECLLKALSLISLNPLFFDIVNINN